MPIPRLEPGAAPGWRWLIRLPSCFAVLLLVAIPPPIASAQPAARDHAAEARFLSDAEALLARGRLDEALRMALERPGGDAAALLVRARLARARGRYQEAAELLARPAGEEPVGDAALELGLLLLSLGRRAEATGILDAIVDAREAAETPRELVRAARAARALGRFRVANGLFREAAAAAPDDPGVNVAWGDLLLEKYNLPEAIKSYEAALQADPANAPALLGLARALADDNPPVALQRAREALAIDPTLVEARVVVAGLALDEGRRDGARDELGEGLAIDPNHLEARALLAAIQYLDGDLDGFEAEARRLLAINPVYGEVYRQTAAQVAAAYRFEEAAALAGRALQVDPDNVRARADLGIHLLRIGEEAEAQASLEDAFARDPFDVVTFNLLGLLDTLRAFETASEGDLVVKLHPDEAPVMREPVLHLARQALTELSARYRFEPRGPILVEMFPRHDDFAVRNVGLPGMIGALGACFGRVVTIDSPRARPPGSFNWSATLWHELAHVITLQLSNQRVPRWLTEGISVYEERRARPHWGRESDFAFLQALARKETLPLEALNAGFSNPLAITIAYHQAALVVEHIVERHGDEALRAMLVAYADGLDDRQVLARVLGTDFAGLQTSFEAFLGRRFDARRLALELPDELARRLPGAEPAELEQLAAEHPGKYAVQVALGRARAAAGDRVRAIEAFERAEALVPDASGSDSPRAWLAQLREGNGDVRGAMAALERLIASDHTGLDPARDLARLAGGLSDRDRLRLAHGRIVEVMPFDAESHAQLGRLALADGDGPTATDHYRRAVAAGPADPVAVHTELAESLLSSGRAAEAKHEVISALEMAPRFERAQELLLRIVDGAGRRDQ